MLTITLYKDGRIAGRVAGMEQGTGGVLYRTQKGKRLAIVSRAMCERHGLEPTAVVEGWTTTEYPSDVFLRMGDNPDGTRIIDSRDEVKPTPEQFEAEERIRLNALLSGLGDITVAQNRIARLEEAFDNAFKRMMETGSSVMPNLPRATPEMHAELATLRERFPAVAVYQQAERQIWRSGAIGSDNTGAGAAGRKAQEILLETGDVDAARSALEARNAFFD